MILGGLAVLHRMMMMRTKRLELPDEECCSFCNSSQEHRLKAGALEFEFEFRICIAFAWHWEASRRYRFIGLYWELTSQ